MRARRVALAGITLLAPALASSQQAPRDSVASSSARSATAATFGIRLPLWRDPLALTLAPVLTRRASLAVPGVSRGLAAESRTAALRRRLTAQQAVRWAEIARAGFANAGAAPVSEAAPLLAHRQPASAATGPPQPAALPKSPPPTPNQRPHDLFGPYADLGIQFDSRIELKGEQSRNERCVSLDALNPITTCHGAFQPQFDFQFGVRTGGTVAERVHVNVDYDSQREFDASNNISVRYQGEPDEILHRVEVGNVSFAPPPSRFISGGIPSGNYGVQAIGRLGPMSFRTIFAQQKGNVVLDRVFTVGERVTQTTEREIADYQLERRRFFWIVDPARAFAGRYPNVDILDPNLAASVQLPLMERPRRVLVYRYRPPSPTGSAARDINGPHAYTRYGRNAGVIGPYEVLQQGVDYYIDPSNLWIVLVTPIARGERLAVSYTVLGADGRETINPAVGGTMPTARGTAGADTVNLLWDSEVLPGDTVFNREIRSVYRLGGEEVQRNTVSLQIVVGSGGDQEKPADAALDTYLQLFGLAQPTNGSAFDVDNRLWPRMGDPNQALNAGGGSSSLIRDYFVVFPSLRPFADSGMVDPPNPVNDSLYRTPDEDLQSGRRPPTQYRIRVRYAADGGGGETGSLSLGSVQVRPSSERLLLDGVALTRDVHYTVDYELGLVTFLRPDTLFTRPRQVSVQYEENPLFATAPTSILGIATEFPTEYGQLNFTAISQAQQTTFNRPPLGFEAASALIAGVSGNFTFESDLLTRALDRLPLVQTSAPSAINLQAEFATSRPQPNSAGVAYVESFEGDGGLHISLLENAWRHGSQPAVGATGIVLGGTHYDFTADSAATLAWQNLGFVVDSASGRVTTLQFFAEQIDSQFVFTGGHAFRRPEVTLWTTLYPRHIGGMSSGERYLWQTPRGEGRRWRSISQSLGGGGVDLTRVEQLEFWALVDTTLANRRKNPAFVMDFGEISENSVTFSPETLIVRTVGGTPSNGLGGALGTLDSVFTGRKLQGFDRLDTERDSITRSFDATVNDRGLPGDVADTLIRINLDNGATDTAFNAAVCSGGGSGVRALGDTRSNCTTVNRRLDEEDLDLDGFLNLRSETRNSERLLRYVIDLSEPTAYDRVGRCYRSARDTSTVRGAGAPVCWVHVRVPFDAPAERLNDPIVQRIKSMRITVVSGRAAADTEFTLVPIARLRLVGSPWLKRSERAIAGVAGGREGGAGYVRATVIGTEDRDSTAALFYESPPGVTDEAESKESEFAPGVIQVNERSLRLVAGDLPLYHRAEAYYRFPEGEKNFMEYEELRVWARGRNKGWGQGGDLQFFIKIGRDGNNFYLYRTPVNSGNTRDAWLPEVRVDFRKFYALRAAVQNAYLRGGSEVACSGLDSALVVNSDWSSEAGGRRYAACDSGYVVYTTDAGITPPSLAAVQELAVGMIRVDTLGLGAGGGGPITLADSLELWVDDLRLTGVVAEPGYAGQLGLGIVAGDVGDVRINVSRRDGNFRQLAEEPTYLTDDQLNVGSSLRLDKFLPTWLGLVLPFSVSYARSGVDPFFLSRSDIRADGIEGLRTPKSSATSYTLAARRARPLSHPVLGSLLNNLSLSATYATATSRSEFQTGRSTSFTGALEWNLTPVAQVARLPGWLGGAALRWNPTQLRLSSAYARTSDRRSSFSLPIVLAGDTARRVTGLTHIWRNSAVLELRPLSALTARWDVSSLRDLRDYGDTSALSIVAGGERERLLGVDVGMERERQMSAVVSAAPMVTAWLKPRVDFSTTFTMLRDPNAPAPLRHETGSGELRVPRRMGNSQGLSAAATVDLARAIRQYLGRSGPLGGLAGMLGPIDVTWRRDLRSSFEGVPFSPSLDYQFALGDIGRFREAEGVPATAAGVSRTLAVTHTVTLPLGISIMDRYSRASSTSWSRVLDTQASVEARQTTFPDLSLRWNSSPVWLSGLVSSVGAQVGARVTKGFTFQPTALTGVVPEEGIRSEQTTKQFPINGSVTWAIVGGLSTSAGWNRTDRSELRSGGLTVGRQDDISVDVGKSFKVPDGWDIQGESIRTRLSYQSTQSRSFFVAGDSRRRVTDNGRWTVTGSADTDVSDTMTFSFTVSRIMSFDKNYDRRFTQTILSAVLQLQFFAGELR